MSIVATLLGEIEAFCRQADITESIFGRRAVDDSKFVARLRSGKGVTVATVERVRAYMSAEGSAHPGAPGASAAVSAAASPTAASEAGDAS